MEPNSIALTTSMLRAAVYKPYKPRCVVDLSILEELGRGSFCCTKEIDAGQMEMRKMLCS